MKINHKNEWTHRRRRCYYSSAKKKRVLNIFYFAVNVMFSHERIHIHTKKPEKLLQIIFGSGSGRRISKSFIRALVELNMHRLSGWVTDAKWIFFFSYNFTGFMQITKFPSIFFFLWICSMLKIGKWNWWNLMSERLNSVTS